MLHEGDVDSVPTPFFSRAASSSELSATVDVAADAETEAMVHNTRNDSNNHSSGNNNRPDRADVTFVCDVQHMANGDDDAVATADVRAVVDRNNNNNNVDNVDEDVSARLLRGSPIAHRRHRLRGDAALLSSSSVPPDVTAGTTTTAAAAAEAAVATSDACARADKGAAAAAALHVDCAAAVVADGSYCCSPVPVTLYGAARDLRRKRIKKVSHYLLGSMLGEGACGVVRDGIDTSGERNGGHCSRCAVKIVLLPRQRSKHNSSNSKSHGMGGASGQLTRFVTQRERQVAIFRNELHNLQRFHCRYLARALDVFTRYGKQYVVMPIAVCTLHQLVQATRRRGMVVWQQQQQEAEDEGDDDGWQYSDREAADKRSGDNDDDDDDDASCAVSRARIDKTRPSPPRHHHHHRRRHHHHGGSHRGRLAHVTAATTTVVADTVAHSPSRHNNNNNNKSSNSNGSRHGNADSDSDSLASTTSSTRTIDSYTGNDEDSHGSKRRTTTTTMQRTRQRHDNDDDDDVTCSSCYSSTSNDSRSGSHAHGDASSTTASSMQLEVVSSPSTMSHTAFGCRHHSSLHNHGGNNNNGNSGAAVRLLRPQTHVADAPALLTTLHDVSEATDSHNDKDAVVDHAVAQQQVQPQPTTTTSSLRHTQQPQAPRLSPTLIKALMYQLLSGVHYLHQQQLAHNDIKPANVLLYENGVCVLSDLGSVAAEYEDQGTPLYAAPELCRCFYGGDADGDDDDTSSSSNNNNEDTAQGAIGRGQKSRRSPPRRRRAVALDAKACDMWCCGMVLYYLVTGRAGPLPAHRVYDVQLSRQHNSEDDDDGGNGEEDVAGWSPHSAHVDEVNGRANTATTTPPSSQTPLYSSRFELYHAIAQQRQPVCLDDVPELSATHHHSHSHRRSTAAAEDDDDDNNNNNNNSVRHLLAGLLAIDPAQRLTAHEALQHPWLALSFRCTHGGKMAAQPAAHNEQPDVTSNSTTAATTNGGASAALAASSAVTRRRHQQRRAREEAAMEREVARRVLQSAPFRYMLHEDRKRHLQFVADCCHILNVPLPREILCAASAEPYQAEHRPLLLQDAQQQQQQLQQPQRAATADASSSATAAGDDSDAARGIVTGRVVGATRYLPRRMPPGCVDADLFLPHEEESYYEGKSGKSEFDVCCLRASPRKVALLREYLHNVVLVQCGYRTAPDPAYTCVLSLPAEAHMQHRTQRLMTSDDAASSSSSSLLLSRPQLLSTRAATPTAATGAAATTSAVRMTPHATAAALHVATSSTEGAAAAVAVAAAATPSSTPTRNNNNKDDEVKAVAVHGSSRRHRGGSGGSNSRVAVPQERPQLPRRSIATAFAAAANATATPAVAMTTTTRSSNCSSNSSSGGGRGSRSHASTSYKDDTDAVMRESSKCLCGLM